MQRFRTLRRGGRWKFALLLGAVLALILTVAIVDPLDDDGPTPPDRTERKTRDLRPAGDRYPLSIRFEGRLDTSVDCRIWDSLHERPQAVGVEFLDLARPDPNALVFLEDGTPLTVPAGSFGACDMSGFMTSCVDPVAGVSDPQSSEGADTRPTGRVRRIAGYELGNERRTLAEDGEGRFWTVTDLVSCGPEEPLPSPRFDRPVALTVTAVSSDAGYCLDRPGNERWVSQFVLTGPKPTAILTGRPGEYVALDRLGSCERYERTWCATAESSLLGADLVTKRELDPGPIRVLVEARVVRWGEWIPFAEQGGVIGIPTRMKEPPC
jgi:hypothetical protein